MDVISDNFPISQREILRTDFLKNSAPKNSSRPEDGPRAGPSRIHLVNVMRDLGDGTRGRKCRVAVVNPTKFAASPIITICVTARTRFHIRYRHRTQSYLSKKRTYKKHQTLKSLRKINCILSM